MARRGMGHRGPGMGHGGHGMPGEKAKDFKGTMRKLMTYLGMYKIPLVFVVLFAVGVRSSIFWDRRFWEGLRRKYLTVWLKRFQEEQESILTKSEES